jgi:hypothetical protein
MACGDEPLDDIQLRALEAFHNKARILDVQQRLAQEMVVFEEYGEWVETTLQNVHEEEGGTDVL